MKLNALILTASLGLTASAPAGLYTFNYTGSFGPTTTLGGTALGGTETPFSLVATFDTTANLVSYTGEGLFAITSFSILLQGTTYTAAPAPDLNVILYDPSSGAGSYVAGFYQPAGGHGFWSGFAVATPAFSAPTPTPSVLSAYSSTENAALPPTPSRSTAWRAVWSSMIVGPRRSRPRSPASPSPRRRCVWR